MLLSSVLSAILCVLVKYLLLLLNILVQQNLLIVDYYFDVLDTVNITC